MKLAPIVLFAYNRPWHTQQTVEALLKNDLSSSSRLIVFSDGPINDQDAVTVQNVRKYVRTIGGFVSTEVIEREKNMGLADSIIAGVTQVINKYGRIIVLEDDMITSPHFLSFMNNALDFYKEEERVWHISGWNYPVNPEGLPSTFLWRVMNCWGWATWADKWNYFKRDPQNLVRVFSNDEITRFNLDGAHNFWNQIQDNINGRIKTWAIFWYAVIFKNDGLCLNPTQSLVRNIGHDGTGTHCGKSKLINAQPLKKDLLLNLAPSPILENQQATKLIKKYYDHTRPTILRRIAGKIKRAIIT